MGTNFYFFRPLTAEEKSALSVVARMFSNPDDWVQPIPFAVPEEIVRGTSASKMFIQNRKIRYDDLREPKTLGPWDEGKRSFRYWSTSDSYPNHIGKRSAAGQYCWKCRLTLCEGGEKAVHHHKSVWRTMCPRCGGKPDGHNRALFVELGHAEPDEVAPRVVTACSSFTWALDEKSFRAWAEKNPDALCIRDEYDRSFTVRDFCRRLDADCPIQFHDSVGIEFS